ncbi:hypothetical protein RJB92_07470 [Staphylococcus hominis]|uniref:hypothetical protein n=1 Tax=Staphylococcus hominis TaxID=1290 RepID=UPI001F55EA68|nr:hypothetical protein [Staphylococcus hominis]MCI2871386.1 hypothetical protein [Staphylococcus hominis]MCI2875633.1 hypothetical protein [Staphylococcus hominis]MCI2890890.1 hypothetical protein [Staphylococcus hominis]MDS3868019.1 hypothetical protein [Staphylococcus hominis]
MKVLEKENKAIIDAWNVLFEDNDYQTLIKELDRFLDETKALREAGHSNSEIDKQQLSKIEKLENGFKEFAASKLQSINDQLCIMQNEVLEQDIENPHAEIIKRQDLQARLSLITNDEAIALIKHLAPTDTKIYDIYLYENLINNRFNELEKKHIAKDFEKLKEKVLYPYSDEIEYKRLVSERNTLNTLKMYYLGIPATKDEAGYIGVRSVKQRYLDVLNNYK